MANQRPTDSEQYEQEDRAYEQRPAVEARAARLFIATAFSQVIDRWLDLEARKDPVCDPAMRQVRRICGRWIGQRRVTLGLSEARLAAITALDATTLTLLELGLAGEDLVDEPGQERLSLALIDKDVDPDWVYAVVEVALGRREAHAQTIANQAAEALFVTPDS